MHSDTEGVLVILTPPLGHCPKAMAAPAQKQCLAITLYTTKEQNYTTTKTLRGFNNLENSSRLLGFVNKSAGFTVPPIFLIVMPLLRSFS